MFYIQYTPLVNEEMYNISNPVPIYESMIKFVGGSLVPLKLKKRKVLVLDIEDPEETDFAKNKNTKL